MLDEFGKDFKSHIGQAVKKQGERMNRLHHCASGDEIGQVATLDFPDGGRKITIDNLDYHQNVHHMTEEHQNIDKHYVTVMATENRVTGNDFSDATPSCSLLIWIMESVFQAELIISIKGRITLLLWSVFWSQTFLACVFWLVL